MEEEEEEEEEEAVLMMQVESLTVVVPVVVEEEEAVVMMIVGRQLRVEMEEEAWCPTHVVPLHDLGFGDCPLHTMADLAENRHKLQSKEYP